MKLSGATFVRNAVKYQYPVVESIKSLIPICDEIIVNLGDSEDNTKDLILSIKSDKIKIVESVWDITIREGGYLLSQQSNIAIEKCSGEWIFYLQADEVVHEDDYEKILNALESSHKNLDVDALVFNFIHFYGSAYTYQDARNWYRQEVRVIRNNGRIKSYGDAQGFRLLNNKKPKAKLTGAKIYHYGWARPPEIMKVKIQDFNKLWHDDEYITTKFKNYQIEDYYKDLANLKVFTGKHPKVVYENQNLLDLENFLFIMQLRERYLRHRTIRKKLRDIMNRISIGTYKGFRLLK